MTEASEARQPSWRQLRELTDLLNQEDEAELEGDGTLDAALLRTSNRLEQVPSYPPDAEKPIIRSVGANQGAIAWFVLYPASDGGLEVNGDTRFARQREELDAALSE